MNIPEIAAHIRAWFLGANFDLDHIKIAVIFDQRGEAQRMANTIKANTSGIGLTEADLRLMAAGKFSLFGIKIELREAEPSRRVEVSDVRRAMEALREEVAREASKGGGGHAMAVALDTITNGHPRYLDRLTRYIEQ